MDVVRFLSFTHKPCFRFMGLLKFVQQVHRATGCKQGYTILSGREQESWQRCELLGGGSVWNLYAWFERMRLWKCCLRVVTCWGVGRELRTPRSYFNGGYTWDIIISNVNNRRQRTIQDGHSAWRSDHFFSFVVVSLTFVGGHPGLDICSTVLNSLYWLVDFV